MRVITRTMTMRCWRLGLSVILRTGRRVGRRHDREPADQSGCGDRRPDRLDHRRDVQPHRRRRHVRPRDQPAHRLVRLLRPHRRVGHPVADRRPDRQSGAHGRRDRRRDDDGQSILLGAGPESGVAQRRRLGLPDIPQRKLGDPRPGHIPGGRLARRHLDAVLRRLRDPRRHAVDRVHDEFHPPLRQRPRCVRRRQQPHRHHGDGRGPRARRPGPRRPGRAPASSPGPEPPPAAWATRRTPPDAHPRAASGRRRW